MTRKPQQLMEARPVGMPRELLEPLIKSLQGQLAQAKPPPAEGEEEENAKPPKPKKRAKRERAVKKQSAPQQKAAVAVQPALAMTVAEFCERHGNMSKVLLYELLKRGEGPATMKAGRRRMISFEAAEVWRREREQATAEEEDLR